MRLKTHKCEQCRKKYKTLRPPKFPYCSFICREFGGESSAKKERKRDGLFAMPGSTQMQNFERNKKQNARR